MIDIAKIIETNKEYVKQHPELPKAGLTSHPPFSFPYKATYYSRFYGCR